ncbi:hypothetical protein HAX54_042375 [Datura stramonium]|uniref:Myb/SANT-like domain-containing protein n=1 Tax=Datura stramonium TaxID=4076 RepID=A0ABS8SMB8_DATST|nr:hypothetical protein [Datura stramonium]
MMRGEIGLGWDATKNTIMVYDDWWERKIKFLYDALFSDIVATEERARAANQEQISGIRVDLDEEETNDVDGYAKEHFTNPNDEASNLGKKSKTKSAAASMKEEIHSLIELMSSKSTTTSPSIDDPTIDKCMYILSNLPDIPEESGIYNYTVNMFLKKDIPQVFLKMTTNEAQKSWLEYNYELHLKEI